MKQCSQNENHWYSNHLSYCPWCKITNETGKDPFPSSTGSQTPIGKQISVTPASEQRRETPAAKFKDPVFKETKPQSYDPIPLSHPKTRQKNNAKFYLIVSLGIIVFFLAFIGSGMMSGNTFSSNNPQDASSAVPSTPIISTASNSSTSGVETVTVLEQPVPLDADFYASATSGKASFTVRFTDNSTGSPTSWNWNFGDRTTSTTRNPTHTYSTAGTYTVEETVTNEAGNSTETKIGYIIVKTSNKPSASPQETSTPSNTATPSTSGTPVNAVTPKNTAIPSKDSGKDSTGGNKGENPGGNNGGNTGGAPGGDAGDDSNGDAGEDAANDATDNATDNNGDTGGDTVEDTSGDAGDGGENASGGNPVTIAVETLEEMPAKILEEIPLEILGDPLSKI